MKSADNSRALQQWGRIILTVFFIWNARLFGHHRRFASAVIRHDPRTVLGLRAGGAMLFYLWRSDP